MKRMTKLCLVGVIISIMFVDVASACHLLKRRRCRTSPRYAQTITYGAVQKSATQKAASSTPKTTLEEPATQPTESPSDKPIDKAAADKPAAEPASIGFDFSNREPATPEGDRTASQHLFIHDYEVAGPGFITGVTYRNDKEAAGPEKSEAVDLIVLRPLEGGWDVVHRVSLPADDQPEKTDGVTKYQLPTPLVVEKGYVFAHWQAELPGPIPLNLDDALVEGRSSGKVGFGSEAVDVGQFIPAEGFSGRRDYFLNVDFRPAE